MLWNHHHKNYTPVLRAALLVLSNAFSIVALGAPAGEAVFINVTDKTVFAGMYQYDWEAKPKANIRVEWYANKNLTTAVLEPGQSIVGIVPATECISGSGLIGVGRISCSSHSRRRVFVSLDPEVIQDLTGINNTSILSLSSSLWFAQVDSDRRYIIFHNTFFFDPFYAADGILVSSSKPDAKDWSQGDYLYPNRLNVVPVGAPGDLKGEIRYKALKKYEAFRQWFAQR